MPRFLSQYLASYGRGYAVVKAPAQWERAQQIEVYQRTQPGWNLVRRYMGHAGGRYRVVVRNPVRKEHTYVDA